MSEGRDQDQDRDRARGRGRDPEREAFELAVAAIARKERTAAELAEVLAARGVSDGVAVAVLRHLAEIGELDDERFARAYAQDKRELRGWGPDRIRATLVERGVDRATAESASTEPHSEQTERAASMLADRGERLVDDAARSRALGYLARRGFDAEVAYEAVRRAAA